MKIRFLLAILLLATCNVAAKARPSREKVNLLPVRTLARVFENESVKPLELVLVLGAMAFPMTLICSYELCRSARVRQLHPVGSFFPLRATNDSRASHDMVFFHCVDQKRIL